MVLATGGNSGTQSAAAEKCSDPARPGRRARCSGPACGGRWEANGASGGAAARPPGRAEAATGAVAAATGTAPAPSRT